MSDFDERLRNHRIHESLRLLGAVLDEAGGGDSTSQEVTEGVARLAAILRLLSDSVRRADPTFVPFTTLDVIANELDVMQAEVRQYVSGGDASHVINLSVNADRLVGLVPTLTVGPLTAPTTRREFTTALEAAKGFRQGLAAMMKGTEATVVALTEQVDQARSRTTSEWESLRAELTTQYAELKTKLEADSLELTRTLRADGDAARGVAAEANAGLAANIRAELDALRAKLTVESESISASLTATNGALNEVKQRVDLLVNDQQTQFASAQAERERVWSASQEDRQARTKALIDDATQRLQALLSDTSTKFNEAQESRGRDWSEWQRDRQDKFDKLFADTNRQLAELAERLDQTRTKAEQSHAETLAQLRADFVSAAELLRKEMEEKKNEIVRLAEIIGDSGTTAGYLRAARVARNAAWVWQGLLVVVSATYAVVALRVFLPGMAGSFEWGPFAGRMLVSLAAGGLATYAGIQADKYLKVERQNRKVALDLAAFGPFVAQLPPARQEEAREKLTERTFGQPGDFGLSAEERTPATVLDAILKDSKLAEKLIDRLGDVLMSAVKR